MDFADVDVEQEAIRKVDYQILNEVIMELESPDKEIFIYRYYEQYTVKEIAEKLGISVYTVQEHISESLQFIKRYLAKHAGIEVGVWILFLFK